MGILFVFWYESDDNWSYHYSKGNADDLSRGVGFRHFIGFDFYRIPDYNEPKELRNDQKMR